MEKSEKWLAQPLWFLGEVGWISQVPQGGIPSEGAQSQCYIWDPVWSRAETHTQEHFMGLGQIWGAARSSEQVETSVLCFRTACRYQCRSRGNCLLSIIRFGVTSGPTCRSTTLGWRCWMTANTATLSTRTPWPCHCTVLFYSLISTKYQHFRHRV